MNLLSTVDQMLEQLIESDTPEEDRLMGIPVNLSGVNLNALKVQIEKHRAELEKKTGRDVHPTVVLLDLLATDGKSELNATIDDYFLLTKNALRDLLQAALYDSLTGLYSRNVLQTRLREEFRRAKRYGLPLSVIFIETDSFKVVNDTYGHLEGDRVLAYIGQFIRANLRDVDFPARYGGDEFVAVLPHTGGDIALMLANRIHAQIAEDQRSANLCSPVTISVGVGTMVPELESEEQLLDAADRAAYLAKAHKDMVWPVVNAGPREEEDESAS